VENARDSVEPATGVPATSETGPYGRAVGLIAFAAVGVGMAVGVHAGSSLFGVATAVLVSALAVLVIAIRGRLPSDWADWAGVLEVLTATGIAATLVMRLAEWSIVV
jgi:hypothetical protein